MASHWTWRLALTILGLGLGGCSEDTFDCIPSPGPITQPNQAPGVVVTGQRVRMKVTPASEVAGCGTLESSIPIAATAEIEGPDGQPVENQFTLVQRARTPSTLEFTPQLPGPHHITVTFSHIGGLHQFDLHAAWDRSAEAANEPFPLSCVSLERTSKGTWVCDTAVVRGSTLVQSFIGTYLAVAGDVIWVADSVRIQRYVDTGTNLVLTASYSHNHGPVEFLLASPDELTVLHSGFLESYFFSSGTLAGSGLSWTRPSQPVNTQGSYGVLLRDGARVGLVTRIPSKDTAAVQVCTYELAPGRIVPPQGTCPSVPGELIGIEPGVLWTRDLPASNPQGQNQGLVRRWQWSDNQIREQGSISLGPNATVFERPMKRWEAVPLVRNVATDSDIPVLTAVVAWSPQRKAVLLEHYDASLGGAFASRAFYWGSSSGTSATTTRIRLRPPTP
jgi:hypothetical protein